MEFIYNTNDKLEDAEAERYEIADNDPFGLGSMCVDTIFNVVRDIYSSLFGSRIFQISKASKLKLMEVFSQNRMAEISP